MLLNADAIMENVGGNHWVQNFSKGLIWLEEGLNLGHSSGLWNRFSLLFFSKYIKDIITGHRYAMYIHYKIKTVLPKTPAFFLYSMKVLECIGNH